MLSIAANADTVQSAGNTGQSMRNTLPPNAHARQTHANTRPTPANTTPAAGNTEQTARNTRPTDAYTRQTPANTHLIPVNTTPATGNTEQTASNTRPTTAITSSPPDNTSVTEAITKRTGAVTHPTGANTLPTAVITSYLFFLTCLERTPKVQRKAGTADAYITLIKPTTSAAASLPELVEGSIQADPSDKLRIRISFWPLFGFFIRCRF